MATTTTTTTSLKLDAGIKDRLQRLAGVRDRKAHYLMREAIVQYVEREERREQSLLERHPEAGRPAEGLPLEFREWPTDVGDSGYVALYRRDGPHAAILVVRHAREFDD